MASYQLEIVKDRLKSYHAQHVNQGEYAVSREPMGTILRSCICVGFYHPGEKVGAISHITGFQNEKGHRIEGALRGIIKGFRRLNVDIEDCECFVIGGTEKTAEVYQEVIDELKRRGTAFKSLDVLGEFHRKLIFDPASGKIQLYKKTAGGTMKDYKSNFSSDSSFKVFQDPKRRLVTGASLFFRNEPLLKMVQSIILPDLMNRSNPRLHVWCAGCSNGMEVYSLAMIILDYMEKKHHKSQLKILGSDISKEALELARSGLYPVSDSAIKKHKKLFERFSSRIDTRMVQMNDDLRSRVVFKQRDLRQGSRNHQFEFVVCDHVLQYFDKALQQDMIRPLSRSVKDNGYAYISSPTPDVVKDIFEPAGFTTPGRNLYHKTS